MEGLQFQAISQVHADKVNFAGSPVVQKAIHGGHLLLIAIGFCNHFGGSDLQHTFRMLRQFRCTANVRCVILSHLNCQDVGSCGPSRCCPQAAVAQMSSYVDQIKWPVASLQCPVEVEHLRHSLESRIAVWGFKGPDAISQEPVAIFSIWKSQNVWRMKTHRESHWHAVVRQQNPASLRQVDPGFFHSELQRHGDVSCSGESV
mmetsp:Transcript_67064/g.147037  ORF Transcript_67064/g.147037 Transcript_67064/m.147037 type:complete len:203 (+) Transcript_67064:106-714(+)